jgi:hypothetical protein
MSVSSEVTPEDWIREKLRNADGPVHPGELLTPGDLPSHMDPVSLQFAFWRMVSTGELMLNRNRSVSFGSRDGEHRTGELASL